MAHSVCEECGFDWNVEPQLTSHVIRTNFARMTSAVRAADDAATISSRPSSGAWSILEYIVHLRDVKHFYRARIGRVLREDRPILEATDFAVLAETARYCDEPVDPTLRVIEDLVAEVASLLDAITSPEWQRTGVGSAGDERSVARLARSLAHEYEHHVSDIRRQL
jgi:DinB superfamily